MLTRVYIETTIPSTYYSSRIDPESVARRNWTQEWWDTYRTQFTMLTSVAVVAELERGTSEFVEDRVSLLDGIQRLAITEEVRDLARLYIAHKAMPTDPEGDALHLAIASIHKVDVLLTWNCRHLANYNKLQQLKLVNVGIGLPVPMITTPLSFLSGEESHD